jgi:hypothetical protein
VENKKSPRYFNKQDLMTEWANQNNPPDNNKPQPKIQIVAMVDLFRNSIRKKDLGQLSKVGNSCLSLKPTRLVLIYEPNKRRPTIALKKLSWLERSRDKSITFILTYSFIHCLSCLKRKRNTRTCGNCKLASSRNSWPKDNSFDPFRNIAYMHTSTCRPIM